MQVQNHLGEMLSVDNDTGELFNEHSAPEIATHKCSKCDASFDNRNSSTISRIWTTKLTTVQVNASTTAMTKRLKQANRRSNAK